MTGTDWTVMLVPDGAGRVRTFHISPGRLVALAGSALLALLVLASLGGAAVTRLAFSRQQAELKWAKGEVSRLRIAEERIQELEEDRAQLAARLAARPSIMPSSGYLSSLFGNRNHPVLGVARAHRGVDIAAPAGRPILAPAEGTVRFAGNKAGGYGYTVEIDHGYGYLTRFAHASRLTVRSGEKVQRGQLIALVGSTGRSTGPHLHYEVEVHGRKVDPMPFMAAELVRK